LYEFSRFTGKATKADTGRLHLYEFFRFTGKAAEAVTGRLYLLQRDGELLDCLSAEHVQQR
jgi:hypothetical protein